MGCGRHSSDERAYAPDFRLETLDHGRFYLNAHRGKSVVLVFWATWCVPCKRELVDMKQLASTFDGAPVIFAAVLTDPENVDRARALTTDLEWTFPVLVDTGGEVSMRYGADPIPLTVIIDREGCTVFERRGYTPTLMQDVRTCIERLLGGESDGR